MGKSRAVHAVLTSAVVCSERGPWRSPVVRKGSSGCVVPGEANCHFPPAPPVSPLASQPGLRDPEFGSVFQGPLVIPEGPRVVPIGVRNFQSSRSPGPHWPVQPLCRVAPGPTVTLLRVSDFLPPACPPPHPPSHKAGRGREEAQAPGRSFHLGDAAGSSCSLPAVRREGVGSGSLLGSAREAAPGAERPVGRLPAQAEVGALSI